MPPRKVGSTPSNKPSGKNPAGASEPSRNDGGSSKTTAEAPTCRQNARPAWRADNSAEDGKAHSEGTVTATHMYSQAALADEETVSGGDEKTETCQKANWQEVDIPKCRKSSIQGCTLTGPRKWLRTERSRRLWRPRESSH